MVFIYNGTMKNILMTIQYDGTNFSGWQRQPDSRTVQGELEKVLSVLCKQKISIQGTSRTDAGVHALGQRAAFKGDFGIPVEKIPIAANHLLAGKRPFSVGDVIITGAEEVPVKFHPRFDAKAKKYIYKIRNNEFSDIMKRNYCYQIGKPLDLNAMRKATSSLTGTKDFRSFMAAGGNEPGSTVRTVYSAGWHRDIADGCMLEFEIVGSGFLYNMVRIIVGTLADIGLGRLDPDEMPEIINSCSRQRAGHTAPPQGLYLAEVYFDEEEINI